MMIPSLARLAVTSCASAMTACLVWTGGSEISHAIDAPVPSPATTTVGEDSADVSLTTSGPVLGLSGGRLPPCPYESNCVSSNYLEPPNRYVSPLTTFQTPDAAFASAVRDLKEAEARGQLKVVELSPKQHYLRATVPGTAVGSLDDVEVLVLGTGDDNEDESSTERSNNNIVHLRCQARVTLPPPPFCLKKNCINGNMDQRNRLEQVSQTLGFPSADSERMRESAKWTPIFFNSDRVPGFDDDV